MSQRSDDSQEGTRGVTRPQEGHDMRISQSYSTKNDRNGNPRRFTATYEIEADGKAKVVSIAEDFETSKTVGELPFIFYSNLGDYREQLAGAKGSLERWSLNTEDAVLLAAAWLHAYEEPGGMRTSARDLAMIAGLEMESSIELGAAFIYQMQCNGDELEAIASAFIAYREAAIT